MEILQVGGGGIAPSSLILVSIVVLLIVAIIKYNKTIDVVTNHSQTPFEGIQFSTQEFYMLLESLIKEKAIPGVRTERVYHAIHGMFSGKREYLRVQYQRYFFDICAAPFAKDFFVSYRQGVLKVLIKSKRVKTFYEEDSENMFHGAIHLCYQRAIEQIADRKGVRKSSDELSLLQ